MKPILFSIFGISFYSFGLFLALAFFFSILVGKRVARIRKLDPSIFLDNFFTFFIAFLLSGRFFYVIFNAEFYSGSMIYIFDIFDGGFSFLGAWFFSFFLLNVKCFLYKQNFWAWFDVFFVSFLISMFFVEIGRFFSGATFGTETILPWGVVFEDASIGFIVPLHPVQIYYALISLIIFIPTFLKMKQKRKPAFFSLIACSFLGFFYFLNGFLRADENPVFFGINSSQIFSLCFLFFSLISFYFLFSKKSLKSLLRFLKLPKK